MWLLHGLVIKARLRLLCSRCSRMLLQQRGAAGGQGCRGSACFLLHPCCLPWHVLPLPRCCVAPAQQQEAESKEGLSHGASQPPGVLLALLPCS